MTIPENNNKLSSSAGLVESYQKQYDIPRSDSFLQWRGIAAKTKAGNIIEMAGKLSVNKVLEVGCGDGSVMFWLGEAGFAGSLYGADISESAIKQVYNKQIKSFEQACVYDGYKLPYEDGFFDVAYCSHVLEHVEYPRALIREIGRVSKYQIYEVPIDFSFYVDRRVEHFCGYGHINIFTPGLLRFLLFSEGYRMLNDKKGFFGKDFIKANFKNKPVAKILFRLKSMVIKLIPYLKGIKPNYYCILTEKGGSLKTIS